MKRNILKYLSVFGIYFAIDLSYQIVFGIPFGQRVQAEAGITDMFASEVQNPILILLWFAIMTFAIVKLAVEPSVKEKNIKAALWRGMILGVTAYSTLGFPNGWSLANYPMALVMEITLEGFLFAPIASVVTCWWMLKSEV